MTELEIRTKKSSKIDFVFNLTGMMFENERRPVLRQLKILRASTIMLITFFQTIFILLYEMKDGIKDAKAARSYVIFTMMLQGGITMAFMMYWQFRGGYFAELRNNFHTSRSKMKIIERTVFVSYTLVLLAFATRLSTIVFHLLGVELTSHGSTENDEQSVEEFSWLMRMFSIYGSKTFLPLRLIVHFNAVFVWATVLVYFVGICRTIHEEQKTFNIELEALAANETLEGDKDALNEELLVKFHKEVEISSKIQLVDNMFEVYTFIMVVLIVPTTVMCLTRLISSLHHNDKIQSLLTVPDILFCLLELFGLTLAPANIRTLLGKVEAILFSNPKMWTPYNDKIHHLAIALIAHTRQSNLGITLWSFTVITKRLVVTIASLTATYLVFFMQFMKKLRQINVNQNYTNITVGALLSFSDLGDFSNSTNGALYENMTLGFYDIGLNGSTTNDTIFK